MWTARALLGIDPLEGSDVDGNKGGDCWVDVSDLFWPGSVSTKSISLTVHLKGVVLINFKCDRAFRNLWCMTASKIDKTLTASNVVVRYTVSAHRAFEQKECLFCSV